jgi:hypothetical protein
MVLWVIVFLGVLLIGGMVQCFNKKGNAFENASILAFLIGIIWCFRHC